MPRREDQFGYGVPIPATTARLVDLAAEIMGEPEPNVASKGTVKTDSGPGTAMCMPLNSNTAAQVACSHADR